MDEGKAVPRGKVLGQSHSVAMRCDTAMMSHVCLRVRAGGSPLICLCVQVAGVLDGLLTERNMWLFESSLSTQAREGEPWVPAAHVH